MGQGARLARLEMSRIREELRENVKKVCLYRWGHTFFRFAGGRMPGYSAKRRAPSLMTTS